MTRDLRPSMLPAGSFRKQVLPWLGLFGLVTLGIMMILWAQFHQTINSPAPLALNDEVPPKAAPPLPDTLIMDADSQSVYVRYRNQEFHAFIADLAEQDVTFHHKASDSSKFKSLKNLKNHIDTTGRTLLCATNAGMYTPLNDPQGVYIEKGQTLYPLDPRTKGYGNFYLQPNGVFLISDSGAAVVTTPAFRERKDSIIFATQSGPMLLIDGHGASHFYGRIEKRAYKKWCGHYFTRETGLRHFS